MYSHQLNQLCAPPSLLPNRPASAGCQKAASIFPTGVMGRTLKALVYVGLAAPILTRTSDCVSHSPRKSLNLTRIKRGFLQPTLEQTPILA